MAFIFYEEVFTGCRLPVDLRFSKNVPRPLRGRRVHFRAAPAAWCSATASRGEQVFVRVRPSSPRNARLRPSGITRRRPRQAACATPARRSSPDRPASSRGRAAPPGLMPVSIWSRTRPATGREVRRVASTRSIGPARSVKAPGPPTALLGRSPDATTNDAGPVRRGRQRKTGGSGDPVVDRGPSPTGSSPGGTSWWGSSQIASRELDTL